MTITVLLFASYAEALGATSVELPLRPGMTVRELVAQVRELDGANRLPPWPMVAVNESYASGEHVLRSGDEVALIPPVAGG